MRFHPFSEVFPLLPDAEIAELADDIKSFGLRERIWLYQGQILDGRNRFLACEIAGVQPEVREFKGTDAGALALVISSNLRRRDLNEAQRASAAAKLLIFQQGGDRRSDQPANLPVETQASAAEKFKVSERSVRAAHRVHKKGSKALNRALDAGEIAVSRAAAVVDLPKPDQLAAAKAPKEPAADLSEFVDEQEIERGEREYAERIERVLGSNDALAQMNAELKRAAQEITALKQARDRYMTECSAMRKQLVAKDREIARLKKKAA
jgi:hypothetical protein